MYMYVLDVLQRHCDFSLDSRLKPCIVDSVCDRIGSGGGEGASSREALTLTDRMSVIGEMHDVMNVGLLLLIRFSLSVAFITVSRLYIHII